MYFKIYEDKLVWATQSFRFVYQQTKANHVTITAPFSTLFPVILDDCFVYTECMPAFQKDIAIYMENYKQTFLNCAKCNQLAFILYSEIYYDFKLHMLRQPQVLSHHHLPGRIFSVYVIMAAVSPLVIKYFHAPVTDTPTFVKLYSRAG